MSESLCGLCRDGWEKVWQGPNLEWQWQRCELCIRTKLHGTPFPDTDEEEHDNV